MARGWTKFGLLLWKNWTLQKRHVVQTVVEILVPIILSVLVVLIRSLVKPEMFPEATTYPEFGVEIPPLPGLKPRLENITIAWSPNSSPQLQTIMADTASKMMMKEMGFASEKDLNDYLISPVQSMNTTLAGVYFGNEKSIAEDTAQLPKHVSITFRFPGESRILMASGIPILTNPSQRSHLNSWFTNFLFPLFQTAGPRRENSTFGGTSPGYLVEGFLTLQQAISTSLIKSLQGIENVDIPTLRMQRFPYPPYMNDPILLALQSFVALIVMLSFVYTCTTTVKVITTEKERQLKEAMKIMGLPNWLHWLAWFLKCLVFLTISVIFIVMLLKIHWFPVKDGFSTAVFQITDGTLVFVFMMLYVINTITFCFAVSVFFSKANTASTIAGLMWFVSYIPYTFMQSKYSEIATGNKIASCLLGNTAMAYGFQLILMHEGTGYGAQWSNIWSAASPDDDFYLGHVMLMLLADSVLYMFITIYVEAVFPGDFGVPESWNFFLKRSYWLGEKPDNNVQDVMTPSDKDSCEVHEPEPTHLPAGVQIRHLKKVYNKKTAVNDLNLNMYEGQITVLLGHNGAGKTTTMSMLTGMITPTSGTAIVSGYDVRTQMGNVRESLGLCPQHNVLFEELTVREHLYFFGKLKGLDGEELEKEIMKYITMMELLPKENKQSSTLSGGMQRKLAACVALCGNSKVVMFDEPTSGMDPTARRALWDLLQAEKKGRTMLLTTHFMDEADLLGDRIAIMAGGDLQCVGSSFYLKKKYGEGYRLVLVKGDACDVAGTTELLRKFIPDLKVSQNIGTELSYLLRDDLSPIFEQMFENLENNKTRLNILSYGVSLTTMEEVFMKAGKDKEGKENGGAELEGNNKSYFEEPLQKYVSFGGDHSSTSQLDVESTKSASMSRLLTGFALSKNQLYAMFMKKVIYTKRSWILSAIQVFLPVFFLIMTFIITASFQGYKDLPRLDITLDTYDNYFTTIVPLTNDSSAVGLYDQYKSSYSTGLIERPLGDNMTQFLLSESTRDIGLVSQEYLVAASFDKDKARNKTKVTAWFNNQPLHIAPLTMNLVYNSVLKKKMGDDGYGIQIVNYPLPFTDTSKISALMQGDNLGFQMAFNIAFGFAFATAFYVLFAIKERVSKAKLLQFVSGVEVLTFWGSALVWDLATFLLPILGVVIVMLAFQEDGYKTGEDIGIHVMIMLLFIWATMPLMYLCSFLFTIPSTGFTRVSMVTIMMGCAMFLIVTIIEYPDLDLENVAKLLDWIFLLVPHYNLAMSFKTVYNAKVYRDLCTSKLPYCDTIKSPCCREESQCPGACLVWTNDLFSFPKPGIGRHISYFVVEGFFFIAVLLLVEFKLLDELYERCRSSGPTEGSDDKDDEVDDFDVANEKYKIRNALDNNESQTLVLRDVTKYYGNFRAVNELCLGVSKGECFGLLGVNGAGKTTTFKMLTGDEKISFGDAFVDSLSLRTNMKEVHQLIGYCPQFDALIDDMTGRETLTMFCLLRGIPQDEVEFFVDLLANDLLFTQHIDKKVKEYSGGNKRKLSTAVALVGDPPVVYLDEPTTGMDPMAKRHLWNVICKARDNGKVIVLTSHSMEECEALCTRAAIMVNGRFKCLGSTQHLKNKFAEGYSLTVKVKRPPGEQVDFGAIDLEPIKNYVNQAFPGSTLREEYQGLLTYYIQNPTLTWARMFGMMEKAKKELGIEDYSLGQTSLEQVFLKFTKLQREEIG